MKNVFIDCGANIGQGFDRLMSQFPLLNTLDLELHMFEPLPDAYSILKQRYPKAHVYQCAVWKSDEERILNIENEIVIPNNSAILGHTTNILQEDFNMPHHVRSTAMSEWPPKFSSKIKCINFSQFIKNTFTKDDNIILKMDIEGSEYEVMDQMIADDTLSYIKVLNIEWHPHLRKTLNPDHSKYEKKFAENKIRIITPYIY
jgi:FkbM family methyltransferase